MSGSHYTTVHGTGGHGGRTPYVYANGHVPSSTSHGVPVTMNGGPGFAFQKRHERIDWRKMASVDVNRVMRELDFATLQDVIMTVTFCDITSEVDMRSTDPNIVKLFQLSQLIAEYLLHSQNYLTHSISAIQDKLQQSEDAHSATKAELAQVRGEIKKIKEECHKRKKMLKQQQSLIQAGANNYHKCPYCMKAFVHAAYLQSHLQRKHPEYVPPSADSEAKRQRENMEREIETLKERLRLSESQMEEEKKMMHQQLELYKKENFAREDTKRLEEVQRQHMESLQQEQIETHRGEMERMQEMFMKELKEMNEKYSSSQLALEDLQSKYGKRSMLGNLEDVDEITNLKEAIQKQKEENQARNRDIQEKLSSAQSLMKAQVKAFKQQTKQLKQGHQEEMEALSDQLKQSQMSLRIEREGGNDMGKKYQEQLQQLRQESREYQKALREKEKEVQSLKSRPPPQPLVVTPPIKPAIVSTPLHPGQQVLEVKRFDTLYHQKSPAKPPPSPTARTPPPILAQSVSSEDEEVTDSDLDSDEEDGEISLRSTPANQLAVTNHKMGPVDSDKPTDDSDGESIDNNDSDDDTLEDERQRLKDHLAKLLGKNLEKRGVPEGVRGISTNSLNNKIRRLKEERQILATMHPHFHDIRKMLKEDLERRVKTSGKKMHADRQPKPTSSKLNKPAAKISKDKQPHPKSSKQASSSQVKTSGASHIKQVGNGREKQTPPPVAPRSPEMPKSSSLKSGTKPPGSPARVSFDVNGDADYDSDEDDDLSDDEEDDSDYSLEEIPAARTAPSIPVSSTAPTQPVTATTRGIAEGMDNDSDWDSDEISGFDETDASRKSGPGQRQGHQQQGGVSRPVPAGRPKSPGIAQKAQKIEHLMSQRRSDHKPVGGVDLGITGQSTNLRLNSRDDGRSPSPRIPTLPDASDDDDDSFAVSSLDGSNYSVPRTKVPSGPVPVPRQGTRPPATGSRKSDTDMSNTYGTSMWGSSKGQAESGTAKSSLVSVTDIDDDDFDFSDI